MGSITSHRPTSHDLGARIYYTGDMANGASYGTIVEWIPSDRFQDQLRIRFDEPRFEGDDDRETVVTPISFEPGPGRRFYMAAEWDALRAEKIEAMRREAEERERRNTCPGCSGQGRLDDSIVDGERNLDLRRCGECAGVFTFAAIAAETAAKVVDLFQWCRCESDPIANGEAFYFDLDVRDASGKVSRSHGWACGVCRKVAQAG